MIESKPNCGYLCGLVRDKGTNYEHAGCSIGIISSEALSEIVNLKGRLSYVDNDPLELSESIYSGSPGQVSFSHDFIDAGFTLEDIRERYGCSMWWPNKNYLSGGFADRQTSGPLLFSPIQCTGYYCFSADI